MKEFVNSLYSFDYVAKESTQQQKRKNLLWLTNCRHQRAIVKYKKKNITVLCILEIFFHLKKPSQNLHIHHSASNA